MRQMGKKEAEQCINNVLDLIGLADQQHTWAKNLSGGMKRRLSIGISLVGDSKVNKSFLLSQFLKFFF